MRDWFRQRGHKPKRLAELTPDELDTLLADHPELEYLLRHTLGVMQFAPPRTAELIMTRVEAIVDETLRRRLPPDQEHAFVMRELEALRQTIATL
jgi:DNA-directed RNA polymerase specialized sigma24 family protein